MTIETPRLRLRPAEAADEPALVAYYRRNEPRFAPWGERHRTDLVRDDGGTAFLALDSQTGAIVAVIALDGFTAEPPSAMLSYTVDGAYEGRGFASEAAAAVVEHAFSTLGLVRLGAYYEPENARSERLLQRLGFREVMRMGPIALPHLRQRGQVMAALDRGTANGG
ncbi:MAG TPA: GNAT family N-acetyltransferase [Candidatus Elarobacter sp.]